MILPRYRYLFDKIGSFFKGNLAPKEIEYLLENLKNGYRYRTKWKYSTCLWFILDIFFQKINIIFSSV